MNITHSLLHLSLLLAQRESITDGPVAQAVQTAYLVGLHTGEKATLSSCLPSPTAPGTCIPAVWEFPDTGAYTQAEWITSHSIKCR